MRVLTIRQAHGVRYLAVTDADARRVRHDAAMIEAVRPLACLDLEAGGRAVWGRAGQWPDDPDGRAAIRAYRRTEER